MNFKSYKAAYWFRLIQDQAKWIETCGNNLTGYIAKYGSANDPDKSGNGGEAIYAADIGELERLTQNFNKAQAGR